MAVAAQPAFKPSALARARHNDVDRRYAAYGPATEVQLKFVSRADATLRCRRMAADAADRFADRDVAIGRCDRMLPS